MNDQTKRRRSGSRGEHMMPRVIYPGAKSRLLTAMMPAAANVALIAGLALVLAVISGHAGAHEFWIEPERHQVDPGAPVRADLRVGQRLKGNIFPYLSNRFLSYQVAAAGAVRDVDGFEGASPSLDTTFAEPGLKILSYISTADRLVYKDWQLFLDYADYEGLDGVVEAHRRRGLPETGFTEAYTRCAKALVQVGAVQAGDIDRPVGMPLELVAEANPYGEPLAELPVQLLWRGAPAAGVQITIFQEMAEVKRTIVRTDTNGRAAIPLAGGGRFLLNAVRLVPAAAESGDAWESYWASLTFAIAGARN